MYDKSMQTCIKKENDHKYRKIKIDTIPKTSKTVYIVF